MGREFASAAARWVHLDDLGVSPELAVVCDTNPDVLAWYERLDPRPRLVAGLPRGARGRHRRGGLLRRPPSPARGALRRALQAGKHLLGEKPFGIDLAGERGDHGRGGVPSRTSSSAARRSSPSIPAARRSSAGFASGRFGRVLEVRSLFLHSSDLDPQKPINWKRRARFNGEYGCMGDLGMHALHLPLRAGWLPRERPRDPLRRRSRAPRRRRRHGRRATPGTTQSCFAR